VNSWPAVSALQCGGVECRSQKTFSVVPTAAGYSLVTSFQHINHKTKIPMSLPQVLTTLTSSFLFYTLSGRADTVWKPSNNKMLFLPSQIKCLSLLILKFLFTPILLILFLSLYCTVLHTLLYTLLFSTLYSILHSTLLYTLLYSTVVYGEGPVSLSSMKHA
jgi:hypothetical protein